MRTDLAGALVRYRVMSWVTGVVLVLLVFVAVPLKYLADRPQAVSIIGPIHGLLYIVYLGVAFDLSRRCRWAAGKTLTVLLAGTIPLLTFVVEHFRTREVEALIAAQEEGLRTPIQAP